MAREKRATKKPFAMKAMVHHQKTLFGWGTFFSSEKKRTKRSAF